MNRITQLVSALAATAALTMSTHAAMAQGKTLTVLSFGGSIDKAFQKATEGFEQKFGVTIRWVPGTTAENAAKIVATKEKPEYDVGLFDDVAAQGVSKMGLFAKIDPSVVTNYNDVRPEGKLPGQDSVPVGFYFTGLFYNVDEFKKNNWAPPTSYDDLYRPEFCKRVGFLAPTVSYPINYVVLRANFDYSKVPDAIKGLGKLKGCVPTLETSSAKLEEKIQLGEYLIGVHGGVRVVPLSAKGVPVRFVIPKEGTNRAATVAGVIKGGNEKLAQEFMNVVLSAKAQEILMNEQYYLPVNAKVEIPKTLLDLGLPTPDLVAKSKVIDGDIVLERRREWSRMIERELAP